MKISKRTAKGYAMLIIEIVAAAAIVVGMFKLAWAMSGITTDDEAPESSVTTTLSSEQITAQEP